MNLRPLSKSCCRARSTVSAASSPTIVALFFDLFCCGGYQLQRAWNPAITAKLWVEVGPGREKKWLGNGVENVLRLSIFQQCQYYTPFKNPLRNRVQQSHMRKLRYRGTQRLPQDSPDTPDYHRDTQALSRRYRGFLIGDLRARRQLASRLLMTNPSTK